MSRFSVRPLDGLRLALPVALLILLVPAASADWVDYDDQTATRLISDPGLGASDPQEKDYDWGDVDRDGDTDLVVVRKQPFTSAGKYPNVLFINQSGVLVDRTSDFASDSDVPGDQGFLTPTNDRDVKLVDVNNDGWLDAVTATTISVDDPKHIGHPRIYMNQCCAVGGCGATSCSTNDWNGFKFENARIPQMLTHSGQDNENPCFCSVSFGDVTGDGYPELYFGDYDSGPAGQCTGSNDFNDKLLINAGASNPGFFSDDTPARFSGIVPGEGQEFEVSAFGAANQIVDVNGSGINDIVKQTSLNAPTYVGTAFNDPSGVGFFDTFDSTYSLAPYFVSGGDLNNDDKLDMVITDDGDDRYLLNDGNSGLVANFTSYLFDYTHQGGGSVDSDDQGFGGNSVIVDLDHDGWNDVLIADVDVDISGCSRRMSIYRNLTSVPGNFVELEEQTTGSGCATFQNASTCSVAGIPADQLKGVHDVAVFDLTGDGWNDIILGKCNGTQVYAGLAPGSAGGVPDGDGVPGSQLTIDLQSNGQITLSWGPSCSLDDESYAIYEGTLGSFSSHTEKTCDTGGATVRTFTPGPGDHYYMVVPTSGSFEGSYGYNSSGVPRHQGASACAPQAVGACD